MNQNYGKAKFIPKPKKFIEKGQPSTTIHQVENSKGYVELKMDPAIRKMSRELTKMNQALTPHLNQAIDASREVTFHMEKTAEAFNKLGSATAAIHKTYKSVADKFDFELLTQIESVYAEVSKTFSSYSKIIQEDKENFSANIENFFTFCTCEVEGLEEVGSSLPAHKSEKRVFDRVQRKEAVVGRKERGDVSDDGSEEMGDRPGHAADTQNSADR